MQKFVCPFVAQLADEENPVTVEQMKGFLKEFVIVDCDPEEAGSAPQEAGEDASVSLAADVASIIECAFEVTEPLTVEQLRKLVDKDNRIEVVLSIDFNELACISDDGTLDGLDNYVDDKVFGELPLTGQDYGFRPVYVRGEEVFFEFSCDVSEILDELKDG